MKLKDYIQQNDLTFAEVGSDIEVASETVRRHANGIRTPRKDEMEKYYDYTAGAVLPNSFYSFLNRKPRRSSRSKRA